MTNTEIILTITLTNIISAVIWFGIGVKSGIKFGVEKTLEKTINSSFMALKEVTSKFNIPEADVKKAMNDAVKGI